MRESGLPGGQKTPQKKKSKHGLVPPLLCACVCVCETEMPVGMDQNGKEKTEDQTETKKTKKKKTAHVHYYRAANSLSFFFFIFSSFRRRSLSSSSSCVFFVSAFYQAVDPFMRFFTWGPAIRGNFVRFAPAERPSSSSSTFPS